VSASRPLVLACTLALSAAGGCGSDPPGSVAHEQPAIDLEACAAGAATCVRTGDVTSAEALLPGDGHAIHLAKGASIRAPLQRPSPTAKLAYLVVAARAIDADATTVPIKRVQIAVKIDGAIDTTIGPPAGLTRTEIESKAVVPGDSVTISVVAGEADLIFVEGRWND
jgi:hypothetical protein